MDVVTLSSGSDANDSDVEITYAYTDTKEDAPHFMNEQFLDAATPLLIDLSEPRWSPHWMRRFKRSTTSDVIEVLGLENGTGNTQTNHTTKTFPPNGIDVDPDTVKPNALPDNSKHLSVCDTKIEQIHLAAEMPNLPQNSIFANNLQLKDLVQKYLFKMENDQEQGGNIQSTPVDRLIYTPEKRLCGSVAGDVVEMPHSPEEDQLGRLSQIQETPSSFTFPLSTQEEACDCHDGLVSKTQESNPSDSKQWPHCKPSGTNRFNLNPRPYQSTVVQCPESLKSSESFHGIKSQVNETPITDNTPQVESTVLQYPESITISESFHGIKSQVNETPITDDTAHVESTVRETCKMEQEVSLSSSANNLCDSIPGDAVRLADSKGWYLPEARTESYCIEEDIVFLDASPVLVNWHDGSDIEEMYEEKSFRSAGQEDRSYVCPVSLQKLMAQPAPDQYIDEDEDGTQVLHRHSLRLVYSTIEESLPEGTVQLLSDLLQPGFYPPKDITTHLLRGILLGPRCQMHLRVQAFDLLMKTQRHHRADKTTIPWDWELLTSTMDNQDPAKRHRCEVVRMLLEYVVRTMEDDFRAKLSSAALKQSIARAFLSCNSEIAKVREVIRWLCSAIMKSTVEGGGDEGSRERDDHIRMASVFQRMLRMALEVDCSPVLSAGRLSQELFHMLLIVVPLRSHRKLLLDSLQSELLKCKLLQHLLEHSCTEKTPLPMSLSLLLHFLKHGTPSQEPTDGAQRWPKWEELVELLWMLLLSYNKVNKGDLRRPITETCERAAIAAPNDMVTKPAVCEAVESLLSRSRADLGQDLPDHIEESLSYLQDHLLDVCQP
ncbi:unnamed protein product [Lota lota]